MVSSCLLSPPVWASLPYHLWQQPFQMPAGWGQLATGAAPPEILRKLIDATRTLTGRPFAVNFIIETTAFGPLATDAHLRVCIEERVPAVVFHWAPPPVEWVRMLKEAACDVWLQTSS